MDAIAKADKPIRVLKTSGNFLWRWEVLRNGQQLQVGFDHESCDVRREKGRWVFNYPLDSRDVLVQKLFVLGLLISERSWSYTKEVS